MFAGRPKTGALKDPPAPRDSDDAKKPAAKGRPKKVVAPTAAPKTRKPRKPRTVDANELVDPMSRVQVHDATGVVTAGGSSGYAEPTGNDPVLANPEQEPEPLDEPQPKKTRRAYSTSHLTNATIITIPLYFNNPIPFYTYHSLLMALHLTLILGSLPGKKSTTLMSVLIYM